ncbi:MAG TPA: cation:proton antiporter [Pyrinomonadaceae bacterium]|nr:cation:proton antiporter [Pyrinomonadaceae bacterium]
MDGQYLVTGLALIGIVIVVSALLSGLIDRSGLPQVAVFIAIGAALGPAGLAVFDMSLDSPVLRVVATLSLALVLFTDAVSLNTRDARRQSGLAFRMLGPGTLLCAALTAVAAWWLLKVPPAYAAILGAALASTDPVLLRGLLRRRDLPVEARQALQLESGLNDVVLLPIVVIAIAFTGHFDVTAGGLAKLGLGLFILGPGAGIAIGLVAVAALDLVRKRTGVRRDYESLYSLGVAFSAYAAAEAVHGSGFLAAFAAGLTIAALDVELCDCFIEYGSVTAEMLLLFTFVIFGSSLIWTGFNGLNWPTIIFVVFAMLIRIPVYLLSLLRSNVDRRGRLLIAWFGPSGLSSLLLVLLPVFAGLPGSDRLFAVSSLVVLLSVVIHGGWPMLLARFCKPEKKEESLPEAQLPEPVLTQLTTTEPAKPAVIASAVSDLGTEPRAQTITLEEFDRLQKLGEKVIILDVRTERSLETSESMVQGAIRMPPEHVAEQARELGLPKDAWLIAYCA